MGALFRSVLGGVWGYVAAAGFAAILTASATYYIVHTANAAEIAGLKLTAAQTHDANVTASLGQLQTFISNMHSAGVEYQSTLGGINARFAALQGELKNAFKTPLPVDCKPDDGRMRSLTAAIAAANANSAP